MADPTKKCLRCEAVKPTTAFSKHRGRADGLQAYCKECSRAANRAGLARNAKRATIEAPAVKACGSCGLIQPIGQFYRDARRPDGHYAACKTCHYRTTEKWKAANPEKVREIGRRSDQRHGPAKWKRYRDANREKVLAAGRERKRRNRARATVLEALRRGRKASAPGHASAEQIAARWAYYGGKCWICRTADAEHLDHVKPLAKGGSNWPSNLRPACATCNLTKSDRWPFVA